jgi:hypothetical protein
MDCLKMLWRDIWEGISAHSMVSQRRPKLIPKSDLSKLFPWLLIITVIILLVIMMALLACRPRLLFYLSPCC